MCVYSKCKMQLKSIVGGTGTCGWQTMSNGGVCLNVKSVCNRMF